MIKFGFKNTKQEEKLLFDFPYLEMEVKPESKNINTRFKLKNNITELLKLNQENNKLSWFYDSNEVNPSFYLININDITEKVVPCINLNKDLSFSNKSLYERMERILSLDTSKHNYFKLIEANVLDCKAVKIVNVESIESQNEIIIDDLEDINAINNFEEDLI